MTTDTLPTARTHLESPVVARLTDRVLFRVSGPGTNDFLQGQLSQNLGDVVAGHAPRAAACTPKGRAYLLTRLVRDHDDILMSVPAALADGVATHLNKYLMLFRGTTMHRLEQGLQFGLIGDAAARSVTDEGVEPPRAENDSLPVGRGHLIRTTTTAEGEARFELWLPDAADAQLADRLASLSTASIADWHASDIAAGIAELSQDTQESWVPQMLNWQHLEGIHFKKGCYTGQEVIARMHFLGQLKKSLFRFSVNQPQAPAPGAPIYSHDKTVGEVVRSVSFDNDSAQLLAVVRHDAIGNPLTLDPDGPSLTQLPLPYGVPEREAKTDERPDT